MRTRQDVSFHRKANAGFRILIAVHAIKCVSKPKRVKVHIVALVIDIVTASRDSRFLVTYQL